jgi:hypothetical protein
LAIHQIALSAADGAAAVRTFFCMNVYPVRSNRDRLMEDVVHGGISERAGA